LNEREARELLVQYCAQLWERRLVTGTSGNVSVRLEDGDLLVTPAGRSLRRLDPAEVVRTDYLGIPRNAEQTPTSELPLHVAAYRIRADVRALIHTHPTFCVIWSRAGHVFPRDTVGARETLGHVVWTPYAPPGSDELAAVTAQAFASGAQVVLMERHGASAAGATLEDAFVASDLAEEAARLAFWTQLSPFR
jgi:ribulose-5-phosphate 4-epimerase/fuculose-1-phosphate aldolase